jgi:hypothetical protein
MFEHQSCFGFQIAVHQHHSAVRIHAKGGYIDRFPIPLQGHVNTGADSQCHPLAAPAI